MPLSILLYALTLVITKGLSLVMLPIVTRYVAPVEFGQLELIVSLIECTALFAGLAIGEVVNRYATDLQKRKEIAGAVIVLGIFNIVIFQGIAFLASFYFTATPAAWLYYSLFAAALTAMVEMPLVTLRIENRAKTFALLLIGRSVLQVIFQCTLLWLDFGIAAILLGNMLVEIIMCAVLLTLQTKITGFAFSKDAFKTLFRLSFPYMLGGLAMFVIGSADRWFLASVVSFEDIAYYGIAIKFSLFVALSSHAFSMWWGGRKYAVYDSENGAFKALKIMSFGFLFIVSGAIMVAIIAPLFIRFALPASYLPSIQYLNALIFCVVLNELATLLSLGAYRAKTGMPILKINGAGAVAAFIGYLVFIPHFGIFGAILATILANLLRILFYFQLCQKITPLPFMQTISAHFLRKKKFAHKSS